MLATISIESFVTLITSVSNKSISNLWQIDARYDCYKRFVSFYISKDRVYCELKNPTDSNAKYNCLDVLNISKKADYCYFKYLWQDEFEEKYQCLV